MQQINRVLQVCALLVLLLISGSDPGVRAQSAAPPTSATTVLTPAKPATLDPAALAAKVEEYMQGQVKTNGFSGSILLAREGKPLVSRGYGFANLEWQIPNTPQTKFRIGSVTKQFMSM